MKGRLVVHLVEDLNVGGIERMLTILCAGLSSQGYTAQLWCLARGGILVPQAQKRGVQLRICGITSYYNPFAFFRLAGMLRKASPLIVHTHGYYAGTAGRIAALLAGVTVRCHHVHSTYHGYSLRNRLIERLLSRITHRIFCCSRAVAEYVATREHIARQKLTVVYNGIPDIAAPGGAAEVLRNKLGIGECEKVIGCVASLTANKGHAVLLAAMERVVKHTADVRLLFVGDGPLREELEQQAHRLQAGDRVIFAGQQIDVAPYLACMDIFVLPSIGREGLPVSMVEAMACGLPVVASRLGGLPEIISHEETGVLVSPGDRDALADALLLILGDSQLVSRLGNGARRYYCHHLRDTIMIKSIADMYTAMSEVKKRHV